MRVQLMISRYGRENYFNNTSDEGSVLFQNTQKAQQLKNCNSKERFKDTTVLSSLSNHICFLLRD